MSSNVTELLASTGATVGTYSIGNGPAALAFDGTEIWVANYSDNTIVAILPGLGSGKPLAVGTEPGGMVFDGTSIWVANYGSNNVTKVLASSNTVVGTYSVGNSPSAVAFDGASIWVANRLSNTLTKIPAH
jgi:DNA-binding beta-propeller fold protein YncE